jgi:hypothetical protein
MLVLLTLASCLVLGGACAALSDHVGGGCSAGPQWCFTRIAADPPVIADVQHTPAGSEVGYLEPVNVTCTLTLYAPADAVQVNWSKNSWVNFALVDMTGAGNGTYWGVIPAAGNPGSTTRFRVYARDTAGNATTTGEHSYANVDAYPPEIAHTNSSAWVTPVAPYYATPSVRINCTVFDVAGIVTSVGINMSHLPGGPFNATYGMLGGAPYYRDIATPLDTTLIQYNIYAYDDSGNCALTPGYTLRVDSTGPAADCWTDPEWSDLEYDDTVYLGANLTEQNAVADVAAKWSFDWGANYSLPLVNPYNDTWRSAAPLPAQAWGTTVLWEFNATDTGGFRTLAQGNYTVRDDTAPNVTLTINSTPTPEKSFIFLVSAAEPVNASGVRYFPDADNPPVTLGWVYYTLESEGYAVDHTRPFYNASPVIEGWYGKIQPYESETVRWWVVVEDNAGNVYTSEVHEYSVGKAGIPGFELVVVLGGLAFAMVVGRRRARQRGGSVRVK